MWLPHELAALPAPAGRAATVFGLGGAGPVTALDDGVLPRYGTRMVNAEAGRIRHDVRGYEVAPYFANATRGDGAWGRPEDALAYAGRLASVRHVDMAVRITDVNTGEQYLVPVPARFVIEPHNGRRDVTAIRDTETGWYSEPLDRDTAELRAGAANVDVLTGDWD